MAMGKLWGMPVIPFSLRSPSHLFNSSFCVRYPFSSRYPESRRLILVAARKVICLVMKQLRFSELQTRFRHE